MARPGGLGRGLGALIPAGVAEAIGGLEDLLCCRVHVVTTGGLSYASEETRASIDREAVPL